MPLRPLPPVGTPGSKWAANYGPSHFKVATDLNNSAVLLWDTGRLSEAEQLIEKALMIDEAEYGPNHHEAEQLMRRVVMVLEANHHQVRPRSSQCGYSTKQFGCADAYQ